MRRAHASLARVACALAALAALAPTSGRAADPTPPGSGPSHGEHDADVTALYEQGRAANAAGRFAEAAEAFGKAYALAPNIVLLWNLAVAEQKAERLEAAKAHLLEFMGWQKVPPALATQVSKLRAEGVERIGAIEAALSAKANAERSERERLEAVARAEREQKEREQKEREQKEREQKEREQAERDRRHVVETGKGNGSGQTLHAVEHSAVQVRAGWGLVAGGALAVGGGIGATFWALDRIDEMDRWAHPDPSVDETTRQSRWSSARTQAHRAEAVAWVAYGVGAAALGVGIALLVLDSDEAPPAAGVVTWSAWPTAGGAGGAVQLRW